MSVEFQMNTKKGKESEESNPFIDDAAFLFLEDIADKQGEGGMASYLISLASSLAKSMPEEEYDTWDEFLEALERGESILTTFEEVEVVTKNCIVTEPCPFERGLKEYAKRIGKLNPQHYNVAEYFNSTVHPGALNTGCVIHQTYRTFAAERIRVGGKKVRVAQISNALDDGTHSRVPDEWLPIVLEKAGISITKLNMLQRNNACIWMVYMEEEDDKQK